jgi:hypothetical protein
MAVHSLLSAGLDAAFDAADHKHSPSHHPLTPAPASPASTSAPSPAAEAVGPAPTASVTAADVLLPATASLSVSPSGAADSAAALLPALMLTQPNPHPLHLAQSQTAQTQAHTQPSSSSSSASASAVAGRGSAPIAMRTSLLQTVSGSGGNSRVGSVQSTHSNLLLKQHQQTAALAAGGTAESAALPFGSLQAGAAAPAEVNIRLYKSEGASLLDSEYPFGRPNSHALQPSAAGGGGSASGGAELQDGTGVSGGDESAAQAQAQAQAQAEAEAQAIAAHDAAMDAQDALDEKHGIKSVSLNVVPHSHHSAQAQAQAQAQHSAQAQGQAHRTPGAAASEAPGMQLTKGQRCAVLCVGLACVVR